MSSRATRLLSFSLLFFVSLAAAGCLWGSGPREMDTPEMHRQLNRVMGIQTSVVLGDVERARSAGSWLATRDEYDTFPPSTDRHRAEIRGFAAHISQSRDMDAIAERVGHLGAACGSCHQDTGGGPRFVVAPPPPGSASQAGTMILRLWAVDRMWDGLVGPSTEAWQAGTVALNQEWQKAGPAHFTSDGHRASGEAESHRIADEAARATTQENRAAVYGELLATCNGCHRSRALLAGR